MSEALGLAERALGLCPAADGAQASVTAERSLTMRFARSAPTQATSIDEFGVEIVALVDGHTGAASTNVTSDEALRECAGAAVAAAEAAARSGPGTFPRLPTPGAARTHEGHDAELARLDPARGGQALEQAFALVANQGLEAHGVWSAGEVEIAHASTAGLASTERVTDAFMKVTAIGPDGRSGFASATGVGAAGIDARELAERAADRASGAFGGSGAGAPPVRVDPGEYPVVLDVAAVGELLGWLGWLAFDGLAHAEGRGALSDRLGTRVTAPAINLSDSPRYVGTLPRSRDAEGVPKGPLALIQDGVANRVCHDTRSAALAGGGAQSTGHALAVGGSPYGAVPTNLVLIGGGAADLTELARPIERGIFVTRLWYTNPIRPKETLMTGQTRDGTYLIEDGEITRRAVDLRMTDSVLGVLERTQALTSATALFSEGEFYGRRFAFGTVCPALRASSMRFTDTAGD